MGDLVRIRFIALPLILSAAILAGCQTPPLSAADAAQVYVVKRFPFEIPPDGMRVGTVDGAVSDPLSFHFRWTVGFKQASSIGTYSGHGALPFDGNVQAAEWLADLLVKNGIPAGNNTVDLQLVRVNLYTRDMQQSLLGTFDDRICDIEANLIPRFGATNGVATNIQAKVGLPHSYSKLGYEQRASFGPEDIRVCEVALAKAVNEAVAASRSR